MFHKIKITDLLFLFLYNSYIFHNNFISHIIDINIDDQHFINIYENNNLIIDFEYFLNKFYYSFFQKKYLNNINNNNFYIDTNKLNECYICMDEFIFNYKNSYKLPCNHIFCKKCLHNYIIHKKINILPCPLCRNNFLYKKNILYNHLFGIQYSFY